jgi:hypothetical protein
MEKVESEPPTLPLSRAGAAHPFRSHHGMIVDCHCHVGRGDGSITVIRVGRRVALGMALILDAQVE